MAEFKLRNMKSQNFNLHSGNPVQLECIFNGTVLNQTIVFRIYLWEWTSVDYFDGRYAEFKHNPLILISFFSSDRRSVVSYSLNLLVEL